MDFSETIVVCDIKVGRCSQLNEYMKIYEVQMSRSLTDLGPNLSDSICLNFFSTITTRPIEAKFRVEPPWDGGTKVYSKGLGHMTKMADMPIYGKNLLKSSSLEPKSRLPRNLVRIIKYSSTINIQMMPLGWPWPILRQTNLLPYAFLWEKVKTMDFQKIL